MTDTPDTAAAASENPVRFSHIIHGSNPPGTISVLYFEGGLISHVNLWAPAPGVDIQKYIEKHWPFDVFEQMRAAGVKDMTPDHIRQHFGKKFEHPDLRRQAAVDAATGTLRVERPQ